MITPQQLQSITRAIEPFEFQHFGAAVVVVGDLEIQVETLARWTPLEGGTAKFADPTFRLYGATMPLPPNSIAPEEHRLVISGFRDEDDSDWKMVGGGPASRRTRSNRKRGDRDEFELRFSELLWRCEGEPFWNVIVAQGFNDATLGKPSEGEVRGFEFEALGRDAAFAVLDLKDTFGAPYAVLIFSGGAPLKEAEVEGGLSLLSLVGGRMVRIVSIAQHALDGSAVSRTIYKHSGSPHRANAPFRLVFPRDGVMYLPLEFGPMLDRLVTSDAATSTEIAVAITHLLTEPTFLDTEIRDLTLALDTLIESDAFRPKNVKPSLPKQLFADLAKPLLDALRDVISPKAHERAVTVINGLNDTKHAIRRQMFWQRVGFSMTEREGKAFAHRHPMSHRGFLQLAKSEDDKDLQALYDDVAILRTLVNRCIFALLGWHHPLQNHATFFDEPMPGNADPAEDAEHG